jgi:predicted amidohydrolase
MKISLLQAKISLGCLEENRQSVRRLLEAAMPDAPDVAVLPEMWSVGFFPKPLSGYADEDGSQTREFLGGLAKEYSVNIVGGSVAVKCGDAIANTSYIFDRRGSAIASYEKIHLFSPTKENKFFKNGKKITSFTLDGVKCGIAICYDIRFPELIRKLALDGIDVLFVPAAWPVERLPHWQLLNTARAVENQIFVAAVNGAGSFKKFHLGGNSLLIDPWGKILNQADGSESIITADFDLSILKDIRSNMNIMHDRQPQLYKGLDE